MAEIVIKLVNGELAGKTMQELNKNVREAQKELSKAKIGTDEFVKANQKLEGAKQLQGDLKKQIEGTTSASNQLKNAWNKLPGAQYFNQVTESFGLMKSGVGGLITQFGVLKSAIISTGIGALVIALITLVDWFKNTDEGATLLSGILKGLGLVVDKLFSSFRAIGVAIYNAFSDPKQAILDLIDLIKTNLINRVKAFGVAFEAIGKLMKGEFKEGLKGLADSVIQFNTGITDGTDKLIAFGTEIANTVKEGITFEQQLDALEDKTRALNVAQAETEKIVSKLLLQSKNVSLSYEERIALLDKASAAEKANHDAQLANAKERERLMQEDFDRLNAVGKATDDVDQKLKDSQVARINLEKESINLQEKIENRRAALLEKRDAEIAKSAEQELKVQENLAELRVQVMADGVDKEIAQIEANTQKKIEALVGSEAQITEQSILLEQLKLQQIQAVRDEFAKQQAEKEFKDKSEANEIALAVDQNNLNEQLLNRQLTEDQFLLLAEQHALEFQQRKLDIIRTAHGEESLEYQKANAEYLSMQQAASDRAVAIKEMEVEDQLAAMQGSLGVFGDFFGTIASMQQQGTKQWKAFATASAIMSTIQGAINAYTSTAAIPIVGGALAPIAAGLALAAGYANVRRIQQTKVEAPIKKAAFGAVLSGPSHADGGIPIEAEGDEIILTKGVYRDPYLRKMASDINVAGGGVKFEAGGPVNPFKDRGPVRRDGSSSAAGSPGSAELQAIRAELVGLRQEVAAWPTKLRVVNVATETEDVLKTVNKIRDDADV